MSAAETRPPHESRGRVGHHDLPQLDDPGKADRARSGVPVVPAFDGFRAYGIKAFAIWAAWLFPASVLFVYLSARFVEQPIRRWARQLGAAPSRGSGRRRRVPAPARPLVGTGP